MTKLFLLGLILLTTLSAFAQNMGMAYVASLPLYDQDTNLGDVQVEINGEELVSVDRDSLLNVLRSTLKEDTIAAFERLPAKLSPSQISIPLKFSPQELKLETKIDLNLMARKKTDLGVDLEDEKRDALQPAPFGGPSIID